MRREGLVLGNVGVCLYWFVLYDLSQSPNMDSGMSQSVSNRGRTETIQSEKDIGAETPNIIGMRIINFGAHFTLHTIGTLLSLLMTTYL